MLFKGKAFGFDSVSINSNASVDTKAANAMAARTLVETWYDAHAEAEEHRLDDGLGRLEFEVTMRVVESCIASLQLESASARILDIGGGPGRYGRQAPIHLSHKNQA